jgi:RNA-binding protein
MAKQTKTKPLTSKQKSYLRGLGHHLAVKAMLGKEGISEQVLRTVEETIVAHELVKVKIQENCPHERHEAAELLAAASRTQLVQVLGRTLLLFRPNPDLPADRRIDLP